ncbi:MAG: relaxase/mobilization nuclease domain-containing protein [Lachnospira sp.]|nr:relaxase/mobilization nuclease domain-containing protein [Lachnospira sp.]
MAITKILNIMESEGRNPASHLKNALEYIQNPDKTEECILVGGINCLPDTAFEQMEQTKNIFHKTGKRQGYHVIISFSPEEKVTAEQAMYVLEHFAKDLLGDDYEAVYAVHTDREHMHGHLIWNSVSMTTGKKYNSPKSNWKNHLQPITNKYCDELGLTIMPAEYSRNPKNISRDKWEKEMSMKEIILRDAKMCAYAAGNVEHFKYLMKRLGYVFKKDAWMEVQAPGFRYYHKLAKLDEMFSEDMLRHYVDMPWMAKPYFYSSDIRGLHRAKLSPFQKKFYAKLYRLRIVEQKRFVVGGAKYTEDLKRFHRLQDEYLLLVNNDIKSVVELVDFISEQEEKIQQIEDRQQEIYRESSSRKRKIKTEAQYREYQIGHVEVQEELDELKQEKRKIKRQIHLADGIIKEDLYTAYYAVSENEEIVADRDVEIPGMEDEAVVEKVAAVVDEPDVNVELMNPNNIQNDIPVMPNIHNVSDMNMVRMNEDINDVTGKSEIVEFKEKEPVDKAGWIVRKILELGGYENVGDSVKADVFGFDIADISGSIRLFSDVMKRSGIKLDGDELYEEFQKIYDESVDRDAGKDKAEDKMWNRGRGR